MAVLVGIIVGAIDALFGRKFNFPENGRVMLVIGMAAVFGSATNTLIAPIMIGLEVFGGADMMLFVVVCVIAYGVNGDLSIYAQERL